MGSLLVLATFLAPNALADTNGIVMSMDGPTVLMGTLPWNHSVSWSEVKIKRHVARHG